MPPSPVARAPQRPPGPRVDPSRRPESTPWRRIAWFAAVTVVLLGLNYWAASRATQHPRVRIPYSPFFLQQVSGGNVSSITSKGTTIEGLFTHATKYGKAAKTRRFKTEIPTFANTDALSKLLVDHRVTINAEPLDTGPPWWQSLLLGFGPTLLFLFLLFWLMRRAGNAQGMLGAFAPPAARPTGRPPPRRPSPARPGTPGARRGRTEWSGSLRTPAKTGRRAGGSRAAA